MLLENCYLLVISHKSPSFYNISIPHFIKFPPFLYTLIYLCISPMQFHMHVSSVIQFLYLHLDSVFLMIFIHFPNISNRFLKGFMISWD